MRESQTYRRGLDDGNGLDNLLLVHLGSWPVKVADSGGHAGLVAEGGGQVDGLALVILGEGLYIREGIVSFQFVVSEIESQSSPCTFPCGGSPACGARKPTNRAWELPVIGVSGGWSREVVFAVREASHRGGFLR